MCNADFLHCHTMVGLDPEEVQMPVRIDQFEEVDPSVFDQYPARKPPGQTDPAWDDVMTRLEQGKTIRLPYGDESQLRGLRLAFGRRAAGRGFRVETRHDGDSIVIRRRDDEMPAYRAPQTARPGADGPPKTRRSRKRDAASDAIPDDLSETME
jgi:hypothetical protein